MPRTAVSVVSRFLVRLSFDQPEGESDRAGGDEMNENRLHERTDGDRANGRGPQGRSRREDRGTGSFRPVLEHWVDGAVVGNPKPRWASSSPALHHGPPLDRRLQSGSGSGSLAAREHESPELRAGGSCTRFIGPGRNVASSSAGRTKRWLSDDSLSEAEGREMDPTRNVLEAPSRCLQRSRQGASRRARGSTSLPAFYSDYQRHGEQVDDVETGGSG